MNTDLIVLLILFIIILMMGIIVMIMYFADTEEACSICPHAGLEICHNCTHDDRERILRLFKKG